MALGRGQWPVAWLCATRGGKYKASRGGKQSAVECSPGECGVRQVMFAPDSKAVLTLGDDGSARLWDPRTASPLGPPFGKADLESGSPSPVLATNWNARVVLINAVDHLRVWDAATGQLLGSLSRWDAATGRLRGPNSNVGVSFVPAVLSPDGRTASQGAATQHSASLGRRYRPGSRPPTKAPRCSPCCRVCPRRPDCGDLRRPDGLSLGRRRVAFAMVASIDASH